MSNKIQQPGIEVQKELKDIEEDSVSYVTVRNKRYKIKWLKNGTRSKITKLFLTENNDDKISCMCAALMVLNGYWKISLFYGILWRIFYYVKQYGEEELTQLLAVGKKKVPLDAYCTNIILLTGLKDTSLMMTKKEVDIILQERSMGQPTK